MLKTPVQLNIIILCALCLTMIQVQAQQVLHRVVKWQPATRNVQFEKGRIDKVLAFNNAIYNKKKYNRLPCYSEVIAIPVSLGSAGVTAELVQTTYTPLTENENVYDFSKIKNISAVETNVSIAGSRYLLTISIFPFRHNATTGQVEKLTSFDVKLTPEGASRKRGTPIHSYAANSVLASGSWYKIKVNADGIYKMDKAFLTGLGINVSGIDPRNIRVYGNGGGMLPEYTLTPRADDLEENAIYVSGQSDGVFNDNDYVLFYGQGPNQWILDSAAHAYTYNAHPYSAYTYYFITTSLGVGKRVATQASLTATPTKQASSYNDHLIHKVEQENLGSTGREWFGEIFNITSSQSFNFSMPDIDNSVVKPSIYMRAPILQYSGNSSITYSCNGNVIYNEYVGTSGTDDTDPFGITNDGSVTFMPSSSAVNIQLSFNKQTPEAEAWLGYLQINYRRFLNFYTGQTFFRDPYSYGSGVITQFNLSNASSAVVIWDVTVPWNATQKAYTLNGSTASFIANADSLRQFVAFDNTSFLTPTAVGAISNQNLHSLPQTDYIVITNPLFLSYAQTLASFHNSKEQLRTTVVTTDQVYNEFSSGAPDATALRDFTKMFYDRANGDSMQMPKYLLLFGNGSYDNKNIVAANNTAYIPTYESPESLDATATYVTDDYFGILADGKGLGITDGIDKMDVGVGRLPANNATQAATMVDKIESYYASAAYGNWRNEITFVADFDNLTALNFISLAESNTSIMSSLNKKINVNKIYVYAYPDIATPGGLRFPDANAAIQNSFFTGTLLMDFEGHGGGAGWSNARIFSASDEVALTNKNKLPVIVTATCDFSRFDNPATQSGGELLMYNADGGAIAMFSTVRLVYFGTGINQGTLEYAMLKQNGNSPAFGWIMMNGKNMMNTGTDGRKYVLLGDPATLLAIPQKSVKTTAINKDTKLLRADSIKALQHITIQGEVTDNNGNLLSNFNGTVYPVVYDKPSILHTLDVVYGDPNVAFSLQNNVIFQGKATVTNGLFSFSFIAPKDIKLNKGYGRISYYANNTSLDAGGYDDSIIVGGVNDTAHISTVGPKIQTYMNNNSFADGGITDANPSIYVQLFAQGGINAVGNSIGHDITGVLDYDVRNTIDLNTYYQANSNSYQQGTIQYPLSNIAAGKHHVSVTAYDVYDNVGTGETDFFVTSSASLALEHVLNYPNPFTTSTQFMFEHNQPGQILTVQIQIFSISGRLVKTILTQTSSVAPASSDAQSGYRVTGIYWDGKDDFGNRIGRGTYIYKIMVRTPDGKSAHEYQKLVVLR